MPNICICHTCGKAVQSLGIARHRAAHRDRREDCEITYSRGDTWRYKYSEIKTSKPLDKSKGP